MSEQPTPNLTPLFDVKDALKKANLVKWLPYIVLALGVIGGLVALAYWLINRKGEKKQE